MASNNWVIHGSLTEDGAPLLANDPHLQTGLPAVWVLNELVYGERYAIGATLIGIPGVSLGRTPDISWGITTPIADNSDLWEEKLNEDETKYFVDGKWKDLIIEKEYMKVKGKDEPMELVIRSTHRGPIVDFQTLSFNAALLFGGKVPDMANPPKFSLGWGSRVIGDTTMDFLRSVMDEKTVPAAMEKIDKLSEDGYKSITANLVLADTSNNIGFMLLVA